LAWTLDALDFHTLTQTYSQLEETFGRSATDISVGVSLSLGFRALGAAIFGILSDTFGRKWPLVCNLAFLVVFELCTGFSQTYGQFLAIRALFGVAMGGVYGNAAATALEDCPEASRGMMSGLYQSGYPFGYLLAVVFWRAFQGTAPGWRSVFWFCAGPPVLVIIWRISLPETDAYIQRNVYRRGRSAFGGLVFEGKAAAKNYWPLLLYLVLLMMGLTYMVGIPNCASIQFLCRLVTLF
jgi:MFS transporter, SHS family, lactate transporter